MLYLDGKVLRRFDVETGASRRIDKLPSVDATASPEGDLVAYVTSSVPAPEDEDFVTAPELHLYEVDLGKDTTVGPGFSPLWNFSGDVIAYLEPQQPRACEGEVCTGSNLVVTADVDTHRRTTLLSAGAWTPLGWLGDRVVVSDQTGEPTASVVSESGETETLSIPTNEFWGLSPDGNWLLRAATDGTTFLSPSNPHLKETVHLGEAVLGEGAWSPDSRLVAAVLLEGPAVGNSHLVLLTPGSRRPLVLEKSEGASGPVL